MFDAFMSFARDDDGAITVDWVVLTAAVVGIGIVFMIPITQSVTGTNNVTAQAIIAAQN